MTQPKTGAAQSEHAIISIMPNPLDEAKSSETLQEIRDPASLKLAAAIYAASDAIMIVDNRRRIECVNPAFEALTGFSASEALGQDWRHILNGCLEGGLNLADALEDFLGSGNRTPQLLEASLQIRSGAGLWVDITCTPLCSPASAPAGAVINLRDSTERKQIDTLKDQFISRISHEFRSPITVILGMASTLLRTELPLPAPARRGLRDIVTQAKRLNKFVENLLIISRSSTGTLVITPEYVRIDRLASKVFKEMKAPRSFSFVLDFQRGFPPVHVDPVKIELVLKNLLENAVKYSPNGGAIRLRGRQEESVIVITLEDQGMGIPARLLEAIYERFFHHEDPRLQVKPGIGLGLTASQIIVQAHGGGIWVESEPGKGSRFAFTIPHELKSN